MGAGLGVRAPRRWSRRRRHPRHGGIAHATNDLADVGLDALHEALRDREAKIVVHCHMGVNRGPSMGFAYLLDQGWQPVDALTAIRSARPIAAIAYASDALRAHHDRRYVGDTTAREQRQAIVAWMEANDIDVRTVIRRIRQAT